MVDHTYPDRHPRAPGSHWSTMTAWEILDTLPPGTLNLTERSTIAGLISGALVSAAKNGPVASEMLARRRFASDAKGGPIADAALSKLPKLKSRRDRKK